MKNTISLILFLVTLLSCTNIKEELKISKQDYKTITPLTVKTDLKVINIEVDQDEFDEMYSNYNEDIEIVAYFNMYKNQVLIIEHEEFELEIKGSLTQRQPLKSLGVKFESKYKNKDNDYNLINPELYPYHNIDKIKSLRLRNSGRDFTQTMIRDISYTKLAFDAGLDLDLMYAEQTLVFVNNKFLGIMNLRTEKNKHGISKLYKVSKNDITIAKIIDPGVFVKKDGDFDKIDAFIEAIEQENFDYLINEIVPSNFIDYFIFESFIANRDWPDNNVVFFAIEDGPFRFFLYDLDLVNLTNIDKKDPLFFIHNAVDNVATNLFDVLYANENFKNQFDVRWNELINSNQLSPDTFNSIVDDYKENVENEMYLQLEKYNGNPSSYLEWYLHIDEMKQKYAERVNYLKN